MQRNLVSYMHLQQENVAGIGMDHCPLEPFTCQCSHVHVRTVLLEDPPG